MLLFENKIVFPATKHPGGDWDAAARFGLADVWFESEDGTRLHGWLAENDTPRGYLLFCHGNGGNITGRGDVIAYLRDRFGLTAFVFDYRGYGRSDGSPNEAGVLADGRAARDWLAEHGGVPASELLLLGRSLGGAVAVDLAVASGAKGLILESTFTTLPDVGASAFPWFPVRWLMKNRFDSLDKIADYRGPILASHCPEDEVIPFKLGKRLFDAAVGEKRFVTIEGRGHNDPQPESYYRELGSFLDRVLVTQ